MQILSIQSSVAYGYAGNSAATFPLQRLGHQVWPVLTVHFSNHTGYGSFRGTVFEPSVVADVVRGVGERGVFPDVDIVLSGYLGSPGVAEVVLDAARAVKAANPAAVYCCDPVMGDLGKGMFVQRDLPELIRSRVVPAADVLTPNAFELAYLAGSGGDPATSIPADVTTKAGLLAAVDTVRATGPRTVLVTSVDDAAAIAPVPGGSDGAGDTGEYFGMTPTSPPASSSALPPASTPASPSPDCCEISGKSGSKGDISQQSGGEAGGDTNARTIGMIAVDATGAYEVRTPRLPLLANGAGDVTAALFVAHLREAGIEEALKRTASSVYAILAETVRQAQEAAGSSGAGSGVEIALVEAQEAIAHPACEFPVTRLR